MEKYPRKLLQIKEYPQQLYCIGNTDLLNHEKIVAIVGSRDCSEYGRKYARIFASELAKRDICIISGLALGIDAAAHFGASTETGKTIAVLGGGLNDIYPKENEWLYNKILQENGCIITEYSNIENTNKANFPKRNRIISGIADAVLVIEASKRSGSRITARYAKEQGKKVYCIPHSLDSINIAGIRELIMDGAKVVTSANQLISDLYSEDKGKNNGKSMQILEDDKEKTDEEDIKTLEDDKRENNKDDTKILEPKRKDKHKNKSKEEKSQALDIPTKYKKIYEILKETMSRDEIAIKANKGIKEINTLLTMMEIEGYIEQTEGDNFKRI